MRFVHVINNICVVKKKKKFGFSEIFYFISSFIDFSFYNIL
jgi:hypothetical protein